jgi:hypothetical protein
LITNLNVTAAYAADPTPFSYSFTLSTSAPSGSFIRTGVGAFFSFAVPDQEDWYTAVLAGGSQLSQPFPDPFQPDGSHSMCFPTNSEAIVTGTLSIFSSDMSLVYSSSLTSTYSSLALEQVFEWNGVTSRNSVASSGVYIYVLQTHDGISKGKFAVIRK